MILIYIYACLIIFKIWYVYKHKYIMHIYIYTFQSYIYIHNIYIYIYILVEVPWILLPSIFLVFHLKEKISHIVQYKSIIYINIYALCNTTFIFYYYSAFKFLVSNIYIYGLYLYIIYIYIIPHKACIKNACRCDSDKRNHNCCDRLNS